MKQGQETNQIWTQEAGTHDTHDRGLTLLPPPERLVPSLNSSIGEGGWALWRPLKADTDRNTGRGPPEWNRQFGGHGGAGSSGGHGGAGSSGGHGGARSSGGHGGAGSSGGHDVARGSGGHGSAGSSGGHGRWSLWPWPRSPRPSSYNRNPFYPPKKIPWGSQGVLGALQGKTHRTVHDMTGQDSRARQTGQDITQEPEALLGWLGS